MHKAAVELDKVCSSKNITLNTDWVPRSDNLHADMLSRCCDSDDWSVQDWIFKTLDVMWGPHTIDRFAYDYNTKCAKFNSKFWCPSTCGIDAFKQNWAGEVNWLVPPPRLINRCIQKAKNDQCRCTLLVPKWRSAPFWPVLYPNGKDPAGFVTDVYEFKPGRLTRRGRGKNGIFDGRPLQFGFLAICMRLDV